MGPDMTNEINSSSTIKGVSLPKLTEDGSNWITYQERLENAVTATKGLRRHLNGTARKPEPLIQKPDGKWYLKGSDTALTNDQIDAHEDSIDLYEQREAQVREFI